MFGSKTFEILTLRQGAWSIEATAPSLEAAKAEANKMLARPNVQGVRVIKESKKAISQLAPSDILFEKLRAKTEDKIFIQHILSAPLCGTADELFQRPARTTINQLFRAYLDKHNITATELMHSAKEMKRLLDEGTLISSATAKVATLQAKMGDGATANERRDLLFTFINEINAKARAAQDKKLPRVRGSEFADIVGRIRGSAVGTEGAYFVRVAIATELVDTRNFFAKLFQLLQWAAAIDDAETLAILDLFISDILWNADVVRELLGYQSDLGSALVSLICLANGEGLAEERPENLSPEHPLFVKFELTRLIAAGCLPDSQAVLLDRVKRQLEGANPLSKGDRAEEREVFRGLLDKLIPDVEIVGGPEMAGAVTTRQSTIINKGGHKGLKEAAASMLPSLEDAGRKTGYLLSLRDCDIGRELLSSDIDEHLDSILVAPPSVNEIVTEKLPPNQKMKKVTSIYYRIQKSSLPEDRKESLTSHLDEVLASYILDSKILEKISSLERPLHVRAFMLASMVQPEMLPKGKAAALAREIIVNHLRRPNFEEELVAQIPEPSEKARTLKRFHEQLRRSGFFG